MLASLITLVALSLAATDAQPLNWEADYGKALDQTRADDRPLLVVLDKPGSEKEQVRVERMTITEERPNDLLQKYDRCRIDVNTEYGKKVAAVFNAKVFPHVAIIDKTGSVILHSHAGIVTDDKWDETLAKHQAGERSQRYLVLKPETGSKVNYEPTLDATPSHFSKPSCPSCQRGY